MSSNSTTPATSLEKVGIDSLIIGRQLTFSVYDDRGTLLIAAGVAITAELKQRLKRRGVTNVLLHPDDLAKTTISQATDVVDNNDSGPEQSFVAKIQSIVSSGLVGCTNRGPAVRDNVVIHGRKAYDPDLQESLGLQFEATGESIEELVSAANGNGQIEGERVVEASADYLANIIMDAENVLSTTMGASFDESLSEHAVKLSVTGMALAVEMGLDADNVRTVGVIGIVQDLGMARIPKEIREAKRPLTRPETVDIQKHTRYTVDILERVNGIPTVVPLVVRQTHERFDGSGYPHGRSGARIHPFARLLSVVDTYIALTSPQPMRSALMPYAAIEWLLRMARRKVYDPAVMRALVNLLTLFPINSFVALLDGSVARVIRRSGPDYTSPIVHLLQDGQGNNVDAADDSSVVDLSESELSVVQALPAPGRNETGLSESIDDMHL